MQEVVVPLQSLQIHEKRAGCVGNVGGVDCATRQLPQQPGVNSTEQQPAFTLRQSDVGLLQQPLQKIVLRTWIVGGG